MLRRLGCVILSKALYAMTCFGRASWPARRKLEYISGLVTTTSCAGGGGGGEEAQVWRGGCSATAAVLVH
jgi:hypothetical protein